MPRIYRPDPVFHTYIGIDPGLSGGIVRINGEKIEAGKMPSTEQDIFNFLKPVPTVGGLRKPFAVIEKVGGYVGGGDGEKGGGRANGSAMFKFGMSYGGLRMALIALRIPFEEITPREWQKALGVGVKGKTETKTEFKNRLKAKAQQLFPEVSVTLATADALLIAEYCRRKHQQKE